MIDTSNLLQTRRHFARVVNGSGAGVSLCSEGLAVAIVVYDQQALERMGGGRSGRAPARDIRALPLCRNCGAKAHRA